jgi:hypothetical protein
VRQLVHDQAVETVRWIVNRRDDALLAGFGKGADAFLTGARVDVLLLELAVRLEQDQLHLEREVVLQVGADLLIGAFGVAGDPLEVRLQRGVVQDFEMVGGVDEPLELVVMRVVLAEVGHHRRLGRGDGRVAAEQHRGESGDQASGQHAGAHRRFLEKATTRQWESSTRSYC